ncbi:MAG TPA: tRNA (adenosine(37)-N6)-threonylcarbamoyltransferase complex ATPase subunit type 1 TsaE [Methylococcaceae bacterium]|nr:tRNA (adenosine(37)-N6)-threonylcarbamoyltransferase complex ATPase subunit type 1 TsaE [Methylococcaceae bacterium]
MTVALYLDSPEATEKVGAALLALLPEKALVFLHGELGAGKTTLVRGLLRQAGVSGAIKSPTYTVIEEYQGAERKVFHFDLYRLADPQELEWLGIDDYLAQLALCLIEWPCKGKGILPPADVHITLNHQKDGRFLQISGVNIPNNFSI